MQLVAYGAQDIYLTGQPQITFFKSVYRRHTNFAVESIQQTINGSVAAGARVTVTISRNGDLLKNLWCQYNPSLLVPSSLSTTGIAADVSHALFSQLEIEIGGQLIDRHYGLWLTVWRDLTECNPTGAQGDLQLGGAEPGINTTSFGNPSTRYHRLSYTHQAGAAANTSNAPTEAYIPMRFWFCRNPGLAIPLIALQYHEVKFNIQFALSSSYIFPANVTSNISNAAFTVYADYVYLDTTERRQFAQNAHEYLIDQLQYQQESGVNSVSNTIRLNFNHPVKELVWVGTPVSSLVNNSASGDDVIGGSTPSAITTATGSASNMQVKIILNGTDRFTSRNLKYFTREQIWDCHTGFGATGVADSIAVYSFALRPEEHQPSGTCNFSRIDTAQLWFFGTGSEYINALTIFAVNYNVLRIMSGMGGLSALLILLISVRIRAEKQQSIVKRALAMGKYFVCSQYITPTPAASVCVF